MLGPVARYASLVMALVITSVVTVGSPRALAEPQPAIAAPRTWVGSWSAAPVTGTGSGFGDQTLREIAHISVGGDQVRIRLTNAFGTNGLVIDGATIGARADGAALVAGSERPVTFGGARKVVLPAGSEVLSDPVPLTVPAGQDLAVSVYVPGSTGAATRHPLAMATSYLATGDHAADADGGAFTSTTSSWYLLDGVDVRALPGTRALVAFGDSITDGAQSTVDANRRYPDDLARRLRGRGLSVLNEGISGNRVLTDAGGSGVSAQARFDRDVLGQTGVRDVLFLEGINDIGHNAGPVSGEPVTAADLIAGMTNLIARAHAHGLRIIGGTLTPIGGSKYDTPEAEQKRQAVNAWTRTSRAFDGVVDFDAVTRDPADPARFLPAYDSGDHLHPGDAGYQAMADAIDLRLLFR
ncbi:SGNH/GDSL hydrolase family protein [Actinoallomurus purpureus]|uniref:SGNH/GDSL hydrolase family protein n=1 Tax=Actinoallomurus purpureus TaxID=478114 RepID=UPI0020925985|nr:SGNH/GDSL hydrolase family protein [Actinoallomurus purpureus]MCO6009383.1 SGNH/GDSL hydrolase family protein [Actinoallomurus purpureus]